MKKNEIYDTTFRLIQIMESMYQKKENKDLFAAFRNSAGKPFSDAEDVWPFLFGNLPEDFLGSGSRVTAEENAVYISLQNYAVCRQGSADNIRVTGHEAGNIGRSLSQIRDVDSQSLDRRFNALMTCATFDEFTYHLRHMIKLFKSRAKSPISVDFAKLAEDLFWYQKGKDREVCFSWAKSYYWNYSSKEDEKNE